MKIVLIGCTGQLGGALLESAPVAHEVVPLSHADIEVTNDRCVRAALDRHAPEVVINTSAFLRVDDCETEVSQAFEVNALAVRRLALACRDRGAMLVHFSTDYVFGGGNKRTPLEETDPPFPLNVYGASKLAGEHLVAEVLPQHFLIRSCGLYRVGGSKAKGGNFVETMLRKASVGESIRVVDDQILTPTHTPELARKVWQLLETREYGLYHITCQGECSWYDFAGKVFELAGLKADLQPTASAEFRTPARRPPYSVLDNARLRSMGLDDLKPWQDALADYLRMRPD